MSQLPGLQVDQHVAAKQPVVKHQVHEEVTVVEAEPLLPCLEQESLAEFEQELLEPVDDRGFQIALGVGRLLLQAEEFQHHRVLDQVRRLLDHLSLAGEAADLMLVAAEGEPLVQGAVQLPLEFADTPAIVRGLDLVETAGLGVGHGQKRDLVRPAEGEMVKQRGGGRPQYLGQALS